MMGTHRVYRSMNTPLTILGAERKLFFLSLILGAATFNLFDSMLAAAILCVISHLFGVWATGKDPQYLRILLNSGHIPSRLCPFKFQPVAVTRIRRRTHV